MSATPVLNTRLELSYRDAGNFSKYLTEVVRGAVTDAQLATISQKLDMGTSLIAELVGLPTPSFQPMAGEADWPSSEMDHVFTVLQAFEDGEPTPASLHTPDAPTLDLDINTLVERLAAVRNWDVEAEWSRMESAAAQENRTVDGPSVKRV